MEEFSRLTRLPAYVFNITGGLKEAARKRGEDIIDCGMGNPDRPTPKHIVDKLMRRHSGRRPIATRSRAVSHACARRSATGTRHAMESNSTPRAKLS